MKFVFQLEHRKKKTVRLLQTYVPKYFSKLEGILLSQNCEGKNHTDWYDKLYIYFLISILTFRKLYTAIHLFNCRIYWINDHSLIVFKFLLIEPFSIHNNINYDTKFDSSLLLHLITLYSLCTNFVNGYWFAHCIVCSSADITT